MPRIPPRARYELIMAVIKAFDNETRRRIMAHLFEAGSRGMRASELAVALNEKPDTVRKAAIVLEQALLVVNEVGRDETGVYSRYTITDFGEQWFDRIGLKEGNRALPLMV